MCRYAVPISFVLMLVGVFGLATVPGTARTTALIVFILHETNVAIHTILVEPQIRYQLQSVPLAMIGAGLGLYFFFCLARNAMSPTRSAAGRLAIDLRQIGRLLVGVARGEFQGQPLRRLGRHLRHDLGHPARVDLARHLEPAP